MEWFGLRAVLTNLDIPKHLRQVVGLGSQVKVVKNVLLHRGQVGILHMNLWSEGAIMRVIS